MTAKYKIGQEVIITPVGAAGGFSLRDSDIAQYAGQRAEITDLYSISPREGEIFYIYAVRIEIISKNVVLHEDEMQMTMR